MPAPCKLCSGRRKAVSWHSNVTHRKLEAFCRNAEAGSLLKGRRVQVLAKCKVMANAALVMKPS